ncbi:hypothetical protein Ancab_004837 [Ancistrocladus abbreviatus]
MATIWRILRNSKPWSWRTAISSPKTLNPSPPPSYLLHPLRYHRYASHQKNFDAFKDLIPISSFQIPRSGHLFPALASGLLGVGMLDIAYADTNEVSANSPLPSESHASYSDLEEAARKERRRLEDLLRIKGMQYGSYPKFTVAVKGQKITIRFKVPPKCEVPRLIANLVSNLGLKVQEQRGASDMVIRAWDSTVAWQLTLSRPQEQKESGGNKDYQREKFSDQGDLSVLIFGSLITSERPEIEVIKQGTFSPTELDALVSLLQLAAEKQGRSKSMERKSSGDSTGYPLNKSASSLEAMGVRVFGLDEPHQGRRTGGISWDTIAGYDQQKREIEDTILLALHSPEVYDDIARGTRCKFESNRPRAVLFEGPPGTGKTSCARVIANQAGVPLLYVPLEVVMSKYYGESERLLGKVFSLANELPDGAIIFLDEVDSFAVARDSEMHEATRRILSVLLRQIDGFEQEKKVVVIAATNRKQDLDPALISRFDCMISFGLPDYQNRLEIAAQYAKHLTKPELAEFSSATEGMSGRDIRDVCQQAERRWASKVIRGQAPDDAKEGSLPPLREYIASAESRRKSLLAVEELKNQNSSLVRDRRRLDFS